MTKEEIRKFLDNTKVYVNGKNEEILKKLFQFGYILFDAEHEYEYTKDPFMYIWPDKTIGHGYDMINFKQNNKKEITADEILSLEVTEPSYRPFKTKEECWNEMLKHQPFGWLCQKCDGYYVPIRFDIYEDTAFTYWFNKYNFADGTPFGIKEE